MLEAACTKAYSLLCMLYLHMIVYTIIEWIQYQSSIHLYECFKRCIGGFPYSKRGTKVVKSCDCTVDAALQLSSVEIFTSVCTMNRKAPKPSKILFSHYDLNDSPLDCPLIRLRFQPLFTLEVYRTRPFQSSPLPPQYRTASSQSRKSPARR